jgi:hypothetical protein
MLNSAHEGLPFYTNGSQACNLPANRLWTSKGAPTRYTPTLPARSGVCVCLCLLVFEDADAISFSPPRPSLTLMCNPSSSWDEAGLSLWQVRKPLSPCNRRAKANWRVLPMQVDACGVCLGDGKLVDVRGACCASGIVDARGACCAVRSMSHKKASRGC